MAMRSEPNSEPIRPTIPVAEFAATFGITTKEARRVLQPLGLMFGQRQVLSAKLWRTLEAGVPLVEHVCCGLSPTAVLALLKAIEGIAGGVNQSPPPVTATVRDLVKARDGNVCRYCGKRIPKKLIQLDHVLPASRGGTRDIENLVVACRECNFSKRDHFLCQWERRPTQSTVRCLCPLCG